MKQIHSIIEQVIIINKNTFELGNFYKKYS